MYEETRVYTTTTKQQHGTQPTVYVDSPNININFDFNYLRTLPGLLKLIAVVSNI